MTGFDLGVWIAIYFGVGLIRAFHLCQRLGSTNEPRETGQSNHEFCYGQ